MSKRRRIGVGRTPPIWRAKSTAEAPGPPGFTNSDPMRWLFAPDAGRRMSESRTVGPPDGWDQSRGTAIVEHWNAPGGQDRQESGAGGGVEAEPGDEEGDELAVAVAVLVGGDDVVPAVDGADGDGAATCLRPVQAAARMPTASSTQARRRSPNRGVVSMVGPQSSAPTLGKGGERSGAPVPERAEGG
jgi:hypothetical protein